MHNASGPFQQTFERARNEFNDLLEQTQSLQKLKDLLFLKFWRVAESIFAFIEAHILIIYPYNIYS